MGIYLGYMVVPFLGGSDTLGASGGDSSPKVPLQKIFVEFFDPPNFGILTYKLAQVCNYMRSGVPYFFFFFTHPVSELWPFEKFAVFGSTDESSIYTMKGQQF